MSPGCHLHAISSRHLWWHHHVTGCKTFWSYAIYWMYSRIVFRGKLLVHGIFHWDKDWLAKYTSVLQQFIASACNAKNFAVAHVFVFCFVFFCAVFLDELTPSLYFRGKLLVVIHGIFLWITDWLAKYTSVLQRFIASTCDAKRFVMASVFVFCFFFFSKVFLDELEKSFFFDSCCRIHVWPLPTFFVDTLNNDCVHILKFRLCVLYDLCFRENNGRFKRTCEILFFSHYKHYISTNTMPMAT